MYTRQFSFFEKLASPEAPAPSRPVRSTSSKPAVSINAKAVYVGLVQDREWLASQWEALHVWLLKRHLGMRACPPTQIAERADILAWMEPPLTHQRPAALSFQACVAVYDPRIDADDFRRAVLGQYRQVLTRRTATVSPS